MRAKDKLAYGNGCEMADDCFTCPFSECIANHHTVLRAEARDRKVNKHDQQSIQALILWNRGHSLASGAKVLGIERQTFSDRLQRAFRVLPLSRNTIQGSTGPLRPI